MSERKNTGPIPVREARQGAEKAKLLLLLLESELRLFRDGNEEVRGVFRQELDEGDVGYVGCLLTARLVPKSNSKGGLPSALTNSTFSKGKDCEGELTAYCIYDPDRHCHN